MNGFVTSRHGDLLVAAHAADERALQRSLKQLDDRLVLALNPRPERSGYVWQVMCVYSDSQPAETILTWDGELSSMLVEEVKRLREVDTLAEANAHNARMLEQDDQEAFDETVEILEDMLPRIHGRKATVLHRGVHLRRARARVAEQSG